MVIPNHRMISTESILDAGNDKSVMSDNGAVYENSEPKSEPWQGIRGFAD